MWLNHFVEFERKQKRENRLILGFYNTDGKAVKVFLRKNVNIPTGFMHKDSGQLEKMIGKIEADEHLAVFSREIRCASNASGVDYTALAKVKTGIRDYHILGIEMPHNPVLEKKLPRTFQTGNYDLFNRLSGFFPERGPASRNRETLPPFRTSLPELRTRNEQFCRPRRSPLSRK